MKIFSKHYFLKETVGGGGGAVISPPTKSYLVEILFKSKEDPVEKDRSLRCSHVHLAISSLLRRMIAQYPEGLLPVLTLRGVVSPPDTRNHILGEPGQIVKLGGRRNGYLYCKLTSFDTCKYLP